MALLAGHQTRSGLTQFARSPIGRSETDGQRAQLGKPRGPSVHRHL